VQFVTMLAHQGSTFYPLTPSNGAAPEEGGVADGEAAILLGAGSKRAGEEEDGESGEPSQKRGRGRPPGSTQNRDKPPKSSTGGQSNFRDRAPKAFKRVGEIELHANGDAPIGPNHFRVECGLLFRLYNESVLKRGRPAAKGDGSVPGVQANSQIPPTVQLWLGKRSKKDFTFWIEVLQKSGQLIDEMGEAPIFDHDCNDFRLTIIRKEADLETGLEASKPKGNKPRPEDRKQPKEMFERKRNLRRAFPTLLTRIMEIEKVSNCVPKTADDFDCTGLVFLKTVNEGASDDVPRVLLYNRNPKDDLPFYHNLFENLHKRMHDNEKSHFTSYDFKKLARLIVFRTNPGVDSYYDQKKLQSVAFIDSALQQTSEVQWQKKCDATRRALADQVAQNQSLQARVAELENGSAPVGGGAGQEVMRLRAALDQMQMAYESEKARVQQLQKDLKNARQKIPGGDGADRRVRQAQEGYNASVGVLQDEKRQLQTEVEHLRMSLSRSQEQVALLQLQGMAAASNSYQTTGSGGYQNNYQNQNSGYQR